MDLETLSYDDEIVSIKRIDFDILGNDEVLRQSVFGKDSDGVEVADLYDYMDAKKGGLIDPKMGTTDNHVDCETCGLSNIFCVGHSGHIKLAEAAYHIEFIQTVKKILGCICLKCSKLLVYKNEDELIDLLKNRSGRSRLHMVREIAKNVTYCQKPGYSCGTPVSKIKVDIKRSTGNINIISETSLSNVVAEDGGNVLEGKKKIRQILTPEDCYNILSNVSDIDCMIMGFDPRRSRPEMMIYKVLMVPPVAIRPPAKVDFMASTSMQDDVTIKQAEIVKANNRIKKDKENVGETKAEGANYAYLLRYHIAVYINNETNTLPRSEQKGKNTKSMSARLKGKEGRVRGNLMGKRVDFSARSVITPDPSLELNELGVPVAIAKNLTFREVVTPNNIEHMTKLVKNGREVYPGANFVFPTSDIGSGKRMFPIDLRYRKERVVLKFGDIVERHCINGDMVLLNRQPTLHKLSMMGHKIKVIDDPNLETFRLNVSVTTPYNADFDGDEMNIFVPQSIQNQIELDKIANVKRQIITPKVSRPIIGIIQDGLLGSYNLTQPNKKIDWRSAMNMMSYTRVNNHDIFRNRREYSGTELFSMIIPDKINLRRKDLSIKNGILDDKKGIMKKTYLGSGKPDSLIGLVHDQYGIDETSKFIDNIQRLVNAFNLWNGFSVGIGDVNVSKEVYDSAQKLFETKILEVDHLITEMENKPDLLDLDTFESTLFSELNVVRDEVGKLIQANIHPNNGFNVMKESGSKGGLENIAQMSGCVGQNAVEGKRMQKKVNNRTLPYFSRDDDSAEARGFIRNSYMEGISPSSFIFHTMSGREGMIDTAIKTAESGYMQRKLIKLMEDATIKYDCSVRNARNTIIQYVYGDSGIDPEKQKEHKIDIVEMNNQDIAESYKFTKQELSKLKNFSETDNNKYYKHILDLRDMVRESHQQASLDYITVNSKYMLPVNFDRMIAGAISSGSQSKEKLDPKYIIQKLEEIVEYKNTKIVCMSETDGKNPKYLKTVDDRTSKTIFYIALHTFLAPKKCIVEYGFDKKQFDDLVKDIIQTFNNAVIEPGTMVGVLAAQSIGEPITQLTLNSVDWAEKVLLMENETTKVVKIGEYIDSVQKEMEESKSDKITYPEDSPEHEMKDTVYIDTSNTQLFVPSVDEDGNMSWKQVTALTKHLPMNKDGTSDLVKIKTQTGKTVTATKAKSFLTKDENGKIVPIRGDELTVGTKVPIMKNFPEPDSGFKERLSNEEDNKVDYDYPFGYIMAEFLIAERKELPDFVFNTDIRCVTGFIEKFFGEDTSLTSESEHFVDSVNLLVTRFGKCCTKTYNEEENNWTLTIELEKSAVTDEVVMDEIVEITEVQPTNKYVYDLTVQDTKTFMMFNTLLQMDTFHHTGIAGKGTSTLGVPRIREILNLSKNMKTPAMQIYLEEKYQNSEVMANKVASNIKHTTIEDIRKRIDLYYDPDPYAKDGYMDQDNVHNVFYSHSQSKNSCQSDITKTPWLMRVELDSEKLLAKEVTLLDIKAKFCDSWERKYESAGTIKKEERVILEKVNQFAILSNNDNDRTPVLHIRFDMTEFNFVTISSFMNIIVDKFRLKGISSIKNIEGTPEERIIKFNKTTGEIEKNKQFVIYTSGVNLMDIRYINGIDFNKIICNDIVMIYETYGIEAARMAIIKELNNVFSVSGNTFNFHHTSVLVDIMTSTGSLISIDRHGINRLDTDPLSRASFERPMDQFATAATFGEHDTMQSVSSCIMVGKAIRGGTNAFDVILDSDTIEKSQYDEELEQKYHKTFNELTTDAVVADEDDDSGFVPDF